MTVHEVIKYFGGVGATARALKIESPSVSEWLRRRKVPLLRQFQIEHISKGKLKVK